LSFDILLILQAVTMHNFCIASYIGGISVDPTSQIRPSTLLLCLLLLLLLLLFLRL